MEMSIVDDNKMQVEELKVMWKDLCVEIEKNNKISVDTFATVFSQTFSILSEKSAEQTIDKKYVQLIAEAYLFANFKADSLDSTCMAALLLTERMLAHCAFNCSFDNCGSSIVYLIEGRREITLDFTDVNESLDKLRKIFDSLYWKC